MRRLVRDIRELSRALRELFEPFDDEAARSAVTASARRFSRRTRRTLDDKLTFTATLMRAGEVEAANHMLAEVERDVRSEEAALIETVNEAHAVRAARSAHMTRLRLARLVAVAMLGSVLMAGSAVGMTLVRMLEDRASSSRVSIAAFQIGSSISSAERGALPRGLAPRTQTFRIGALKVRLDASQARAYELIASGRVGGSELEALLALLPREVQDVLTTAATTVAKTDPSAAEEAVETVVRDVKKKAKAEEQPKAEEEEPEPSPEPSPSDGESGGGGSGDEEDEGGQNGLILTES